MSILNIEITQDMDIKNEKVDLLKEPTLSNFYRDETFASVKCGEILVSKIGDFTMLCMFCDEKFSSFNTFATHIYETHLDLDNEDEEEDSIDAEEMFECERNEHISEVITEADDITNLKIVQNQSLPLLDDDLSNLDSIVESEIDSDNISTTQSDKSYICDICGRKLASSNGLVIHKSRHEIASLPTDVDLSSYLCRFCGRSFVEINRRIAHELTHERIYTIDKPFSCEKCGKSFQNRSQVKRHLLVHSEERNYKCDYCDSTFKSSDYLKKHLKIHLNDKKYECDYCGKRFLRNVERKIHMRSHTGEKPCQCEICGRNYRSTAILNEHKKIHSDLKPFSCEKCGNAYHTKKLLRRHEISHSETGSYSCDICAATFSRREALRSHKNIHLSVQ